ncbi:MAG: alpha-hydroxy-acid oxidizing protein [Spirochaetaceae bacterium]|jgi:isopentenyl diphosphate isomerase/L-lactate dehydrogenase-like FMN-dependent dehydrogenase|nr:alpha-hydroxy-acid oxidizing protein [Spirochaetaceae bacterium]
MSEQVNAGNSEKITRDYLDSLLVEMRHIDAVEPSTRLELYGETFTTPVMLAALSHLNKTHPGGMVEAARGLAAAGGVMWTGMGDEAELEAIIATGAKTIKIIKPYADNGVILKKIAHAEQCGCLAVGMDIDHQFGSKNSWGTVLGIPMAPKTLEEIKTFVKATKLPFIIKGVLSEQDTKKCLDARVGGIVVSHHHGMVDYSLPPLQALPRILTLVNKRIPLFVDCGINRGLDAFKALALGAAAVSAGRVVMEPLRNDGALGVQRVIEGMTAELKWAMAVTCSRDIRSIDPSVIRTKS